MKLMIPFGITDETIAVFSNYVNPELAEKSFKHKKPPHR